MSILRDEGFSLIEVLVALSVAGLVVAAVAGMTGFVLDREARQQQVYVQQEGLMAAERVFRSVVSRAVPNVRRALGDVDASGTPAEVTLLSFGPDSLLFDRPEPLTLFVDKGADAQRLLLRWEDPNSGTDREELVLSGAKRISLSYFEQEDGAPLGWSSEWSDPYLLPSAISLQLELPALGPPIDVVVRTRAALPNACIALPHEPYCESEVRQQ